MMQNSVKSGEFKFSVDSSLLFQLGEQLVTRPSIALAELVKNAYDADATKVTISMEHVEQPGGTIVVEDNGHGMTFEEMQDSWMRIATTTKRDKPVSRMYCRPLTGAKGIGRFAARRLGNKLMMQSIAERDDGIKESVIAKFDWASMFLPGEDLTKVPVSYVRQEVAGETETGASLFIEEVRDIWTEDELAALRRDILSLQSPFPDLVVRPDVERDGCQPDPGFNIELSIADSRELEKLSGGLGEAFFETAWARLDGRIDEKGKAHYEIDILRTGEQDSLIDDSNDYGGLENARLRVYFFIYLAEYFEESDFGVRDAQRKGRQEGGVRIYLDGFRVFPYGEQADDWLRLDEYAVRNVDMATRAIAPPERVMELASSIPGRPFLLIPRNRQLFGAILISQTQHSDVEINISRERLIETDTVGRLREFVQNGLYWMTLKYAAFLAGEKAKRRKEKPKKSIPEIIEDVKATVEAQSAIPEEKRQYVLFNLDRAIEQAKEEEEERISEISMLRILASAGTTITLMNHQLQAFIGAVSQTEQDLLRLRPHIPEELYDQYDDITAQVTEWHEMVERQVSQLGFLLSPDSRQRRKQHALREVVENVRKPMSYYMKKYGVKFENNIPPALRTPPIFQSELYSVLINILSNALKAVYGRPIRRVAVEAEKSDKTLFLRMMDTGVGLPVERREISFKSFVTTSLPNPILGVGTGLGLKVVRDILELYGGTARFVDVQEPWKTCIEIVLPERRGRNDN